MLIRLKTNKTFICCLQETQFGRKYTQRLKVREWKKILHANRNDKEAEVVILIRQDFKTKSTMKVKKGII